MINSLIERSKLITTSSKVVLTILTVLAFLFVLPIVLTSGGASPLCHLGVASAQGNDCLNQEATIGALELSNLRQRATNSALQRDNLALEITIEALETEAVEFAETATAQASVPETVLETVEAVPAVTATLAATATEAPEEIIPTVADPIDDELPATATLTATATEAPEEEAISLPPTAENSQVVIVEVVGRGDLNREAIRLRNDGPTIEIGGWTISDTQGNEYVFREGQRLFTRAGINVFTRSGIDTATSYFWGLDTALFPQGTYDAVILRNNEGVAQAVFELP